MNSNVEIDNNIICTLEPDYGFKSTLQVIANGYLLRTRLRLKMKAGRAEGTYYTLSGFTGETLLYPDGTSVGDRIDAQLRFEVIEVMGSRGSTNESSLYVQSFLTSADLVLIENLRRGNAPLIKYNLRLFATEIMVSQSTHHPTNAAGRSVEIEYKINLEDWTNLLSKVNVVHLQLVEIPVDKTNSSNPDLAVAVNGAIIEMNRGGGNGYKNAVVYVRNAMDIIEKIYQIPKRREEWWAPNTRLPERFYLGWWALKNLCHVAAHGPEDWSRAEAQYIVNSFLLLLNVINEHQGSPGISE